MSEKWKNRRTDPPVSECAAYLKSAPVFDRLLQGFREKYASYGSFTGTVVLRGLTEADREALEGFFGKSYHGQKSASVSAGRFRKALEESRFRGIDPKELLEAYFREPVAGKKELREERERLWRQLAEETAAEFDGTSAGGWIRTNMEEEAEGGQPGPAWLYLRKRYREAGETAREGKRLFRLAGKILNNLPGQQGRTEYLAVFAAVATGNPHAFDDGRKDGQLLGLLIREWAGPEGKSPKEAGGMSLFPALKRQREYLAAGILRDDISNYVMACGIRAWKRDGSSHQGMDGFCREGDMVQIPLAVIAGWSRADCPRGRIFIVENPSVYAMLCGKWKGKEACMCMNGQPRLSALLLLDLLAAAGTTVYYAGDFDPEGLLIAWKLKQYYPGAFHYWQMTAEAYRESLSGEAIPAHRLKMLSRVQDPCLEETVEAVKREKKAGYQENIWQRYLQPQDASES